MLAPPELRRGRREGGEGPEAAASWAWRAGDGGRGSVQALGRDDGELHSEGRGHVVQDEHGGSVGVMGFHDLRSKTTFSCRVWRRRRG